MSDRRYGWALLGAAIFGSVAGGVLIGQQASAEMAPFYANLSATIPDSRQSSGVQIVSDDGPSAWIETADLSYRGATTGNLQDSSY